MPEGNAPANTLPNVRWEKRKRPANAPSPARAGTLMTYHRGRGILCGGVHDVEDSEEGISSEFFNDLFAWNIDRNRFFQLHLRRPRKQNKLPAAAERNRRQRGKADEEELLRNLAALETKGGLPAEDASDVEMRDGEDPDDSDKAMKPMAFEMPHQRFNAALTVQADTLYIFGGTYEKGDVEHTFDEMWSIDLDKLDGCKEIFRRELPNWEGSEDEESEDDSEEEESGDDLIDDDDTEMDASENASPAPTTVSEFSMVKDESIQETIAESALLDSLPHPRPFESLKDFYARTSEQWQEVIIAETSALAPGSGATVKELRKEAFHRANETFWDCREEIRALEIEQEEAGIGEIVNAADRAGAQQKRR